MTLVGVKIHIIFCQRSKFQIVLGCKRLFGTNGYKNQITTNRCTILDNTSLFQSFGGSSSGKLDGNGLYKRRKGQVVLVGTKGQVPRVSVKSQMTVASIRSQFKASRFVNVKGRMTVLADINLIITILSYGAGPSQRHPQV